MNKEAKLYFDALKKDREDSANMLEKPSMRGVQRSVVEKYSDQAHFIYELLQNADDVEATKVTFNLYKNELIFRHNGKRHFSVSNPANEEIDQKLGKLGDINSITSIANSNKSGATIGKFGVGFKSVFQYTLTPKIYDPNFCFQIDRFIVPSLLYNDFYGRKKDETIFVFPFNNPEKKANDAYEDISEKFENLKYPLLFLSNLKEIDLMINNQHIGNYSKKVEESYNFGNINALLIHMNNDFTNYSEEQKLWLFTSSCFSSHNSYSISVGFFVNDKGQLQPVKIKAFCFFQTKEVTNLNFIIHAPFLLTDSREGIKANDYHNKTMINELSKLAAKSILLLKRIGDLKDTRIIDDKIIEIIPTNENNFRVYDSRNEISFKPFYTEILNLFQDEEIIPTIDGYTTSKNAYFAKSKCLVTLFSNKQLAMLSKNPNAKWVFTSIDSSNKMNYIRLITRALLEDESLLRQQENESCNYRNFANSQEFLGITGDFIEKQSFEWIHRFYKWINESQKKIDLCKQLPIFIDSKRKAVAAFNSNEELQLFFPFEGNTFYKTINKELLKNKETNNFLTKKIGIKKPTFKDEIINVIIPKYEDEENIEDTESDFKLLFEFYKECTQSKMDEFINLIKKIKFLIGYTANNKTNLVRCNAPCLYFPSDFLFEYFETSSDDIYFINIDYYKKIVIKKEWSLLTEFLIKLGVSVNVKLSKDEIPIDIARNYVDQFPYYTKYIKFYECHPEGFDQLLENIKTNPQKSVVLWNYLLSLCDNGSIKKLEILQCEYYCNMKKYINFVSIIKRKLQTTKWILNSKNKLVSPREIFPIELKEHYDVNSTKFPVLINFLEIKEKIVNENFTKEQQDDLELMSELKEKGLLQKVLSMLKDLKIQELQNMSIQINSSDDEVEYENEDDLGTNNKTRNKKKVRKNDDESNENELNLFSKYANKVAKKFLPNPNSNLNKNSEDEDIDEDEFIQPSKKIFNKNRIVLDMMNNKKEIEKIAQMEELRSTVENATKYSFLWFKTLLQMEINENSYRSNTNTSLLITFSKVEIEKGTNHMLILKNPNICIPLYMENLTNIQITLYAGGMNKKILVEVINIVSNGIRAKIKSPEVLDDVDLSFIKKAEMKLINPDFVIDELQKSFNALNLENDFNMCDNLCQNIDFIYGPPGTGKTTHLAQNVIIPLISKQEEEENENETNIKILVLTPTNKAADICVKKIIECMKDDSSYMDWLIRFGTLSDDTNIIESVYRDKSFDISKMKKMVVVTTIHRFSYDFFIPESNMKTFLKDINWDYIIFDESSMIPLINIIYPLYKQKPKKFIVAGDPFQIQPITMVDLWKNENIYTLVELNSFTDPKTRPCQYKIDLLTTQYRSVPSIGNIYNKMMYGGILNHYRSKESIKKLNIEEFIMFSSLNIIKFPVNNSKSIYNPKKLQNMSSYHIYCSLFVFEFVQFLTQKLTDKNQDEKYSIGIISAYRAQTDLMDNLFSTYKLPENINLQIGTIHGFQGDECDIVFAVFNPPPNITSSPEMFLNNKNMINVSISRTKDYLFFLMPDDGTENVNLLKHVKNVEMLCKQEEYTEFDSHEIERLIYGDENFIENNSFTTGHQLINTYNQPNKKYEIRCDESAIDIFIK